MPERRMPIHRRRFCLRAFASFGLLWSFGLSALAGVALYFRPEGSLAAWSGWSLLGLNKSVWEGVHTLVVVAMIFFGVLHIVFNRKALWGYLRRTAASAGGAKLEFAAATLIVALFAVAAIGRWKPALVLLDARAAIKKGSLAVDILPPVPDAVSRSVSDLCAGIPVPVEEAAARLARAGYEIDDASRTLEALAASFGTSPEHLYRLMAGR